MTVNICIDKVSTDEDQAVMDNVCSVRRAVREPKNIPYEVAHALTNPVHAGLSAFQKIDGKCPVFNVSGKESGKETPSAIGDALRVAGRVAKPVTRIWQREI